MTELPNRLLRGALADTASAASSGTPCLDADVLAAWADGTLSRADRGAAEAHAASCERCLALLAAMARTEPPTPVGRPWWRAPIAWLLPLAAAVALIIAARLPELEQRPPAPALVEQPAISVPKVATSPDAGAPATPPAPPAAAASPARRREPAASAAPPPPLTAAQLKREVAADAPPRSAPAAAESVAKDVAATPPAAAAAPPAAPAPPSAFAAQPMMKAAARVPIVVLSPDGLSQWRIVGGAVEHTTDGGATWQPQSFGTAAVIRAGAAPDARVCWLAGVGGVVLRTTDGATWRQIAFPTATDLIAIEAADALHATVTTGDGRRFSTSDGGTTWTRL